MRTHLDYVTLSSTGFKQGYQANWWTPGEKYYGFQGTWTFVRRSTIKSDLIITPIVDGWRKPSDYKFTLTDREWGQLDFDYRVLDSNGNPGPEKSYSGWIPINMLGYPFISVEKQELESSLPSVWHKRQAIIKARNKVADRKASFSESVAEVRSTFKELGGNAESLRKFGLSAIRKDWKGCARALGFKTSSRRVRRANRRLRDLDAQGMFNELPERLSSAWLMYSFGISPIVSDMVSMAAFVSDEKIHHKLRVHGKATLINEPPVKRTLLDNGAPYGGPRVVGDLSTKNVSGSSASLWWTINATKLRDLATYGAFDVYSTAWAVVPWSFVVDWVIPVSEVLKSISATTGLTYRGGSTTQWARIGKAPSNMRVEWPSAGSGSVSGSKDVSLKRVDGFHMIREIEPTEPNPVALWVKDPFDAWKAGTSLALLTTLFSKHK